MNTLVMVIITLYVVVSILVGVCDLNRMYIQKCDLDHTPTGDIGYYVVPEHITGIHNIIFLPSILIILACLGISKLLGE